MRAARVVSSVLLLSLTASAATAHADWRPLGSRWAIQTNAKGQALEIDDLSYGGVLGRAIIGHIKPIAQEAHAQGLRSVPDEWWTTVPWKKDALRTAPVEPESFTLDDIDFDRATTNKRRFDQIVKRWDREVQSGFLKGFRFVRAEDGGYRMEWSAPAGSPDGTLPVGTGLRVVNLRKLTSNLWHTLGIQAAEMLLSQAVSLISIPVVSALLCTAVDRYFHFRGLLVSTRQEALAEVLTDPPPGFELNTYESGLAAQALLYAETSLIESPKWIWQRPAREWRKRLARERFKTTEARKWLQANLKDAQTVSTVFDWRPAPGRIFATGFGIPWGAMGKDGPPVVFDHEHPNTIIARRITVEVLTTGVVFASSFVPIVGGIQAMAFKMAVQAPEDRMRMWEARLAARLEEQQDALNQNWERELTRLAVQQANPFELNRAQSQALVGRRRAALGLPIIPPASPID